MLTNVEPLTSLVRDVTTPFDVARVTEGRTPISVAHFGRALHVASSHTADSGFAVNVLDMPIKLPFGELRVPHGLPSWVHDVIDRAVAFEAAHVTLPDPWHIYLTVQQSVVASGTTQRHAGAHIDGMQGSAYPEPLVGCHAYLLSTVAPTTFYPQPFRLSGFQKDRDNLFRILDEQKDVTRSHTPMPGELVVASCYSVHEAGVSPLTGLRTFVRVEFSMKRFDREENTRNARIDTTTWEYLPRPIPTHLR
jgi:hypothetical protein